MYQLCCFIILLVFGSLASSAQDPSHLYCDIDAEGNVNVVYTGDKDFLTYPVNNTSTKTDHDVTVCVFDASATGNDDDSIKQAYHVVCRKENDTTVSLLDIQNGTLSEFQQCMNATYLQRLTTTPVVQSPDVVPEERPHSLAALSVIDSEGYTARSVETRHQIRLRVQAFTDKPFQPPIIGRCWYNLTIDNGENNIRTMVESDIMFVDQGCSMKGEHQLIETDQDVFYSNGFMEKVSYPFNLMELYEKDFDIIQITCETYFCKEKESCSVHCGPTQTSFQMSEFPLKLNLTTEVNVVFLGPTNRMPETSPPVLVFTEAPKHTAMPAKEEKSNLEKVLPYLIIGTLSGTSIVLITIVAMVTVSTVQKCKRNHDDVDRGSSGVFRTNISPEEIYHTPSREKQKLVDDNKQDLRLVPLNPDQRYHGNQMYRNHGNQMPSDQNGRQAALTTPKSSHGRVLSPPPAYISKSLLVSPQRAQSFLNYGFEEDRSNHFHGNKRSDHKISPVGGELYHGNADFVYRPSREALAYTKDERHELRPHRSDTALLNTALREYFDNHSLLY